MISVRLRVALATTTSVFATVLGTAANADCLPSANPLIVICDGLGTTGGYQTSSDAVTISVTAAGTVGSSGLSAGANSVVNNNGTINNSISLAGNGTVTNASNATGNGTSGGGAGGITGSVAFGNAGTGQVNTLNNNTSSATLIGVIKGSAITSAGNSVLNNQGFLTGSFTQTGSGSVAINNGSTFTNATFTGDIVTAGDTTLTNGTGATITGNITLGAGTDVINNSGTITGNVDMGGGTNTYNANGQAQLPSGTLTASATSLSTLNLSGSALTDTVGQPVTNFTFVNKSGTGTWTIAAPITLNTVPTTPVGQTNYNVTGGILSVNDADYLAGPNNSVTVGDGANLTFNGTAAGTYTGGIGGGGTVTIGTGAGATTFSGANTYSGGTTINAGILNVTGGSALLDTGAVTLQAGGRLNVNGSETIGALNDADATANTVNLVAGQTLTVGSGAFGNGASTITGAGALTKATAGTLTLSGTNTFTGPLTINDGVVAVSNGAAIGDTTAVIVNATTTAPTTTGEFDVNGSETIGSLSGNGGKVVLASGQTLSTGNDGTDTSYLGVISGAGSLTKVGTGTFTVAGANTYSGGTSVAAGTLQGNTTSLQGAIAVAAPGTLLFTQPTDGTFAGVITGAGTTTKAGAGNLTLTGNNSGFTGTTNLNGGTVSIGAANNIGAGPLAFDGGTLATTAAMTLTNAVTLNEGGAIIQTGADTTMSGVFSGSGGLTKTGAATLILGGVPTPFVFNTFTGGITISQGTLQASPASLNNNDIVDNAALVFDNAGNFTFSGDISGTGTVTVGGTGNILTLTGNNTYSGATQINAGALYASTGTGIGDLSAVTVASGAEFEIGGVGGAVTETIGSLAGAGDFSVNNPADHLITGGNNSSTTFSGDATGGQIEKVGTGVFTVSGTGNLSSGLTVTGGTVAIADGGDYTATTSVASGATLDVQAGEVGGLLTGDLATAAGAFAKINGQVSGNVTNAGTLSGNGTVTGTLTNSGNVMPGNSPGVLNIDGAYVQTATGTFTAEINGAAAPVAGTSYDQIAVTGTPGTATLDGTLAVVKSTATNYVAGAQYDIVTASGGITGNFATITGNVVSPFITLSNAAASGGGIVATEGGDVYRLVLVRSNYSTVALTPNQTAVANGLQSLVGNAAATATVTALDNMTAGSAQTVFDQASPESYGAYATAIEDQSNLFTRQVALQMNGSAAQTGKAIWLNGYGQWGSGSNSGNLAGSDQDITGIAGGLNFGFSGLAAGVAGGYSEDKVNFRRGVLRRAKARPGRSAAISPTTRVRSVPMSNCPMPMARYPRQRRSMPVSGRV